MKLLMLVVTGSKLHNTNVGVSDTDFKGICFPERDELIGLKNFEQCRLSNHIADGVDKIEGVVETVRRQISFIYNGDLSGTETCFADPKFQAFVTPIAQEICTFSRQNLLSKRLFKAYNAYFRSQVKELQNKNRVGKRKHIVEQFGYDTKFAMHAFRLGCQSIQVMREGTLSPTLGDDYAEIARNMRMGKYTFEEAMQMLNSVDAEMYDAYKNSTLRPEPDFGLINKFIVDLHLRYLQGAFNELQSFSESEIIAKIKAKAIELDQSFEEKRQQQEQQSQ